MYTDTFERLTSTEQQMYKCWELFFVNQQNNRTEIYVYQLSQISKRGRKRKLERDIKREGQRKGQGGPEVGCLLMRAMPRWAVNRSTNISKAILFSEGCEILSRTFPNWISCLAFVMCHCSFCPTSSIQQQGRKRRERLCAWDWEINTGYMWHSARPKSVRSLKKKRSEIQSAITETEGTCGELLSGYGCRSNSPTCTHSGPCLDPTTKAPPLARSRGWIPWINYCPPLRLWVINSMKWAIKGLRSGNRGGRLQRWSGGGDKRRGICGDREKLLWTGRKRAENTMVLIFNPSGVH